MLRLALAQVNATVGDLEGNATLVREQTAAAAVTGARLVVFPEMFLTGYPVEDLALRESFIDASRQTLSHLAADLARTNGDVTVMVGYLDRDPDGPVDPGRPRHHPRNALAVIRDGRVQDRYFKHHLPNYGVFDEFRYFVPGTGPCTVTVDGWRVAVAICEDLWQDGGPVAWAREQQADLLVVINGSPYERNKDDVRLELVRRRAREAGCALAYVNLVGGQDELVFDGDSLVVDADGRVLARAPQFEEHLLVVDLDAAPGPGAVHERLSDEAEVYAALLTGTRDYVRKNGFASVLLGVSGGIDSALCSAIAVDALGPDHVHAVSLPSVYSSLHSREDAQALAIATGLHLRTVPIAGMVDAFQAQLGLTGLAEENLQARVRGTILMAISNSEGHLVLAPGNKSELSVGYSTLYGDAVGGYAPIKDVPKTLVWRLARWRNAQAAASGQVPPIPESSVTKPPSAELRPGQLDTDSLPEYGLLDDVLDDYVERDASAADLVALGFDQSLVERLLRLTDLAEYKRRQYPPGPKISLRAFGRDRRLPMTSAWREQVVP